MSDKFGIQPVEIIRYNTGKKEDILDSVSVEEPLEIRISGPQLDGPTQKKKLLQKYQATRILPQLFRIL